MTMQIKTISLYGKNDERRDVEFELGTVNIITGASKRGKTSLIDIVEYCLGASECTVKEGCIKNTVEWYAVLLQFCDSQVFIARAAPVGGKKANSDAHMIISYDISIPDKKSIISSTNISDVVKYLTLKIGVPEQITDVPESQTRSEVKLGFRHSRYYLFLSQNEIANNDVLFHQQSKAYIPQNIKDTLPYFIGAAEDNRLNEKSRLRELKRERNKLIKQVREIEALQVDGLSKGYELLNEAVRLGMYKSDITNIGDTDLIKVLTTVARWSPKDITPSDIADPLSNLEKELEELLEKRYIYKLRIREAKEYESYESNFRDAANNQVYRLKSIGLFRSLKGFENTCPVCDASNNDELKFEKSIKKAIVELESKLDGVNSTKPRISGYLSKLQEDQKKLLKRINVVKRAIFNIKDHDPNIKKRVNQDFFRAQLVGKVSLYLEGINWNKDVKNIKIKIVDLDEKIDCLLNDLDPEAMKEKLNAQLSCIAEDMTKWARELKLEHSEHRIRLDLNKLTIVSDTPSGVVSMSNMGSGENWVGYHLVAYFALAKWFIENSRPVGNFIFLDQPSQVYFPAENSITGSLLEIEKDEDREALKQIFKWIFQIVKSLEPRLQVIITDHADIEEYWFQQAVRDNKWRGDYALIPKSWYELQ
ncbi:DUF3732 domain-containing protein [Zooshikella sp. RANM57]|uniref:DUF3732 domain-containing protein n=1 Tax=Zooshikella sp. RANM57 TaxID=3425863 RepID=UPI003D700F5B